MRGRRVCRLVAVAMLSTVAWATIATEVASADDCVTVDMAASPRRLELLTDLARRFGQDEERHGRCATVHVQKWSSGESMALLQRDWPNPRANGPRPTIWLPAASTWASVLDHRREVAGKAPIATDATPFMMSPLVIAMPKPMAQALGWPTTPIGFADVLALAQDPSGWAGRGHPEWGEFRLGKTNPSFSTSGLSGTVAAYYAATGKTADLTLEDLGRPEVEQFERGVESAVVHYGDTTLTFLNNLYRWDQRGNPYGYASAIAVEEKSVIDYNAGNPDGILDPGEKPHEPHVPLVAVYPKEGTLYADNPLIVLDAPWVSADEAAAAKRFITFATKKANQEQVLRDGFRPGNPAVALGGPIKPANGVDPAQPQTTLEVPAAPVLDGVIDQWNVVRKRARVLLTIDVSGSMGEAARGESGPTKLDLAKRAARKALDQFQDDDEVGLRIFSTDLDGNGADYVDIVPVDQVGTNRPRLDGGIDALVPHDGTPLYTAAGESFTMMSDEFDRSRINAVVLLTDGHNEDPNNDDLAGLLDSLGGDYEGLSSPRPVRIFSIAYGADADESVLQRIAEATDGSAYSAIDPTTVGTVFNLVMSNF